jgi:hypothetical protein
VVKLTRTVRRILETSMVDMDGETMYGRRTITRSVRPCTATIGIEGLI